MSDTPRTDAKIVEIDMMDLSIGHKLRENQAWAKHLERELAQRIEDRFICPWDLIAAGVVGKDEMEAFLKKLNKTL